MNVRHKIVASVLTFMLIVLVGFAALGNITRVHAQDVLPEITDTPTAQPTEEVTSEPPITVPEQPGGTLVIGWNAFSQFIGLVIGAMAAGFVLSLGSIIIIVRSVRQNEGIKSFARYLYLSQPADVRQKEKELVELGKELVGLGEDVTSADDTPPPSGTVTSPVAYVPPNSSQ